jgi:small subunit ribosomal protein S4
MSRYRGPRVRIIRRLGELPALTRKVTDRNYLPGQHGKDNAGRKPSISEYGIRLQEKQKLRYNYHVSEKQLFGYVKEARRLKGATGTILLQLLEMRLDNIVFRLGLASTIPQARQFINHGHILVNNKRVTIPSFSCVINDTIVIKNTNVSKSLVSDNLASPRFTNLPKHLELDKKTLTGVVKNVIQREDVGLTINELIIVEFYSRR